MYVRASCSLWAHVGVLSTIRESDQRSMNNFIMGEFRMKNEPAFRPAWSCDTRISSLSVAGFYLSTFTHEGVHTVVRRPDRTGV